MADPNHLSAKKRLKKRSKRSSGRLDSNEQDLTPKVSNRPICFLPVMLQKNLNREVYLIITSLATAATATLDCVAKYAGRACSAFAVNKESMPRTNPLLF